MSYSAGLRNNGYNEQQTHILRRANELRNQSKVNEDEEIVWTAYANTPDTEYNEQQIHILRRANELRNQPKVDEGEEIVWTAYANTPEIDYKDPLVQLLMLTNTLLQVEFLIEPNWEIPMKDSPPSPQGPPPQEDEKKREG